MKIMIYSDLWIVFNNKFSGLHSFNFVMDKLQCKIVTIKVQFKISKYGNQSVSVDYITVIFHDAIEIPQFQFGYLLTDTTLLMCSLIGFCFNVS